MARAADGLDLTPLQVALLWVRDAPGVTAPLLGARTPGQLAPALAVEEQELPAEIVSALDDVSGGPAPRAACAAETEPTGGHYTVSGTRMILRRIQTSRVPSR